MQEWRASDARHLDRNPLSFASSIFPNVTGAGFLARSRSPPLDDGESDDKANTGGDDKRQQDGIMSSQCGIDCCGKDPKLRDVDHDEHD
jgi:hypothetical protein